MRRSWTTIREVLELVERDALIEKLKNTDPADDDILYGHLLLCLEAGLITGCTVEFTTKWFYGGELKPRLTMAGHDTLDALRSRTIWSEIKRRADQAMIPITVTMIQAILGKISASA